MQVILDREFVKYKMKLRSSYKAYRKTVAIRDRLASADDMKLKKFIKLKANVDNAQKQLDEDMKLVKFSTLINMRQECESVWQVARKYLDRCGSGPVWSSSTFLRKSDQISHDPPTLGTPNMF